MPKHELLDDLIDLRLIDGYYEGLNNPDCEDYGERALLGVMAAHDLISDDERDLHLLDLM